MWARCRRESMLFLLLCTLQPSHAIRSVARDGAFVGYSEREKVVDYSQMVTGVLTVVFHSCLIAGISITCTSVQEKSIPVGPGQLCRNMYTYCVRLRCCVPGSTSGCCHNMHVVTTSRTYRTHKSIPTMPRHRARKYVIWSKVLI